MIPAQTSLKGAFKRIIIRYRFEQNVCKALKVREFRGFAIRMASISTEFSTSFVENDTRSGNAHQAWRVAEWFVGKNSIDLEGLIRFFVVSLKSTWYYAARCK